MAYRWCGIVGVVNCLVAVLFFIFIVMCDVGMARWSCVFDVKHNAEMSTKCGVTIFNCHMKCSCSSFHNRRHIVKSFLFRQDCRDVMMYKSFILSSMKLLINRSLQLSYTIVLNSRNYTRARARARARARVRVRTKDRYMRTWIIIQTILTW